MPQYKLKEIDGEDKIDQVIEKSDFSHEFTVRSILEHKKYLEKNIKELTSQRDLEVAKMTNYTENHPYILELDDEKQNAVTLYRTSKLLHEQCVEKLAELDEVVKEYDQVGLDIKEQTGLDIYGN